MFIKTTKPLTPLRAIRGKCLDCCEGQKAEVRLCPSTDCSLYVFRLGKSPKRRLLSVEQRQAAAERLKRNREWSHHKPVSK